MDPVVQQEFVEAATTHRSAELQRRDTVDDDVISFVVHILTFLFLVFRLHVVLPEDLDLCHLS
jgi:hypothetical protein